MKPADLVRVAGEILEKPVDDPGMAERAAAFLARQALEELTAAALVRFGLGERVDFTSQLICLQGIMADKDLAKETAAVWGTLSTVVHHDGLELSPTESEVKEMIGRARSVVAKLEARSKDTA